MHKKFTALFTVLAALVAALLFAPPAQASEAGQYNSAIVGDDCSYNKKVTNLTFTTGVFAWEHETTTAATAVVHLELQTPTGENGAWETVRTGADHSGVAGAQELLSLNSVFSFDGDVLPVYSLSTGKHTHGLFRLQTVTKFFDGDGALLHTATETGTGMCGI